MTRAAQIETLKILKTATNKAHRALLNDPKVLADPTATHTPSLYAAWTNAADAECAFRVAHDLQDWPNRRRRA